jgi:DNA-binding IclR family transcriptional regulator
MTAEPRTIGAVERVCTIIDLLEEEERVGVSALAERLEISKGTMSTYLSTLAREGYVVKIDGKYQLSLRYLSLGETVKYRIPVYDNIEEELTKLADSTGERCQFALEEQGKAIVACMVKGDNALNPSFGIGTSDYLHSVGFGKAMLANLPREKQKEIVNTHSLPAFTDNTITDQESLFEELAQIREQGYAVDDEERIPGIRCIAVPIETDDGGILGAISVSGPATRMSDDRIENEIKDQIMQVANVIQVDSHLS